MDREREGTRGGYLLEALLDELRKGHGTYPIYFLGKSLEIAERIKGIAAELGYEKSGDRHQRAATFVNLQQRVKLNIRAYSERTWRERFGLETAATAELSPVILITEEPENHSGPHLASETLRLLQKLRQKKIPFWINPMLKGWTGSLLVVKYQGNKEIPIETDLSRLPEIIRSFERN